MREPAPEVHLSWPRRGGAAQRIDIPESDVSRKFFESAFSGHFGSGPAEPHDAELRFGSLIKNIDHVAGLQLRVDALQGGPAAADGAKAGWLSEGTGIRIHPPDLDGEVNENPRLTAPVHARLLGFRSRFQATGGRAWFNAW